MSSREFTAAAPAFDFEPGSFRDRGSRVFLEDGQVFRLLSRQAYAEWQTLRTKEFFQRFAAHGALVATEELPQDQFQAGMHDGWAAVLRHDLIPFISYAYEWCFGMLRDAALAQLDLLLAALDEGMILKDATPYNMQWRGSRPVFIDIPSFVTLRPGAAWVAYRQFCQLYLYPLLLQAYKNVPYHCWLRGAIEGIEPAHINRLMSWGDLWRPGVLTHVYLHARFQARYAATDRHVGAELKQAGFHRELIQSNVRGLSRIIRRLRWKEHTSEWAEYATDNSYTPADHQLKIDFVRRVTALRRWKLAWDLGANTGEYSRLAAEHADYVLALDKDQLAVERLYQQLKREQNLTILPLVGDLADPSVNRGWRGLERKAFTSRGRPDLILCLALIHHLAISANIPLRDFVHWLASLGSEVVIEFVTRRDPMVEVLLRNKEEPHEEYNLQHFEDCLAEVFQVLRRVELTSGLRVLYHMRPK
jgi:hypothetical protein